MAAVPATKFTRNFAKYQDEAREESVAVTSHGRVTGYFIAPRDYEEYVDLKAKSRQNIVVGALTPEQINAIRASKMSAEHNKLNALMDE